MNKNALHPVKLYKVSWPLLGGP